MNRQIFSLGGFGTFYLVLLIALGMPQSSVAQDDDWLTLEESVSRLKQSTAMLRPLLDRSQFDLNALLESQDYDAESIVDFVTNEIDVEIYDGVLRGALGTLVSQAGNSVDQALLAATLLRDAGYEVVIRRGHLGSEDAAELINLMFQSRESVRTPWTKTPQLDDPSRSAARSAEHGAWVEAAEAQASRLQSALKHAGIDINGKQIISELELEAVDYFWVEYRDGPTSPWKSAHPALKRDAGATITGTFRDGIPAALAHRVTIEVVVQQKQGTQTIEEHLFATIEYLGPDLVNLPLQISILPDQLMNMNAPIDPAIVAGRTSFLLPLVNGEPPADANALSTRGLLVPIP